MLTPPGRPTLNCDEPLSKVTLPLRWERVEAVGEEIDERLWFEASCGGRDSLDGRNPHTFIGRMSAWCPHQQVGYNVSLAELAEMSSEARYFVKGFLSGTEPSYPADDEGETKPEDMEAWSAATARFRRTGSWFDRWRTCDESGCVLLPDSSSHRCAEHQDIPPPEQ
jgi:hypothetical protein